MKNKKFIILFLSILLLLALAACNHDDLPEPTDTEPTEEPQSENMSIFDKLDTIITFATESNKDCELNNWLKPEKRVLFESIIANAKDLKKALKKEAQGK